VSFERPTERSGPAADPELPSFLNTA